MYKTIKKKGSFDHSLRKFHTYPLKFLLNILRQIYNGLLWLRYDYNLFLIHHFPLREPEKFTFLRENIV